MSADLERAVVTAAIEAHAAEEIRASLVQVGGGQYHAAYMAYLHANQKLLDSVSVLVDADPIATTVETTP